MRLVLSLIVVVLPAFSQTISSGSTFEDGNRHFSAPPVARSHVGLTAGADEFGVILVGGIFSDGSVSAEAWRLAGEAWSPAGPDSPSPVVGAGYAFSINSGGVVQFGGQDGDTLTNQTYQLRDEAWTLENGNGPLPSPRRDVMMLGDSNSGLLYMFGGRDANGFLGDTWLYDGNSWSELTGLATSPPARAEAAMAWDDTNSRLILFGGIGDAGVLGDAWAFSNNEWTQIQTAFPAPRYGHGMTTLGGSIFLFGGQNDAGLIHDFHRFDGTVWAELTPAEMPPQRRHFGFAPDLSPNMLVLYGGETDAGTLSDTWVYTLDTEEWRELVLSPVHVIDMSEDADGVLHYGAFVIESGATVRFQRTANNDPITILTVGGVRIDGTLEVSGSDGVVGSAAGGEAAPGTGGYQGGRAAGASPATGGDGPGGGAPGSAQFPTGGQAGHSTPGSGVGAGRSYGTFLATAASGGSGGGGGFGTVEAPGGGGGGGGGAITIIASSTISLSGEILAQGGLGATNGGNGSGGMVRLVAGQIAGDGLIDTHRDGTQPGWVRLEAETSTFSGVSLPAATVARPTPPPVVGDEVQIRVLSINDQAATASTGNTDAVDISFTGSTTTILLSATGVPDGERIQLRIVLENGQVLNVQSDPLAGGQATATASVPVGSGTITPYVEY